MNIYILLYLQSKLDAIFTGSPVANEIAPLWKKIGDRVCSLTPRDRILGMGPNVYIYFNIL